LRTNVFQFCEEVLQNCLLDLQVLPFTLYAILSDKGHESSCRLKAGLNFLEEVVAAFDLFGVEPIADSTCFEGRSYARHNIAVGAAMTQKRKVSHFNNRQSIYG
jgi:hypothetical protein